MSLPGTERIDSTNLKPGGTYILSARKTLGEAWVRYEGEESGKHVFTVTEGTLSSPADRKKKWTKGQSFRIEDVRDINFFESKGVPE
jgi:hypothetical protein